MIRRPWLDRLRVGVLALVAFVLAHGAIYLGEYGASYDAVLDRTGHGGRWTLTVGMVLVAAAVLALASAVRLVRLSRAAAGLGPGAVHAGGGGLRSLAARVVAAWPLIFLGSLATFVVVENLEHLSVGLAAPGLAVLGPSENPIAVAVIGLVSLLVAAVEGLYRWRRDVLVARLAAARARRPRPAAQAPWRAAAWADPRLRSIAGHHVAGRAPPAAA